MYVAHGQLRNRQKRYKRVHGRTDTNNFFRFKKKEWWRRGESEYSGLLKTRGLLKNRRAQKSKNAELALNWNVSGTRDFPFSPTKSAYRVMFVSDHTPEILPFASHPCARCEGQVRRT